MQEIDDTCCELDPVHWAPSSCCRSKDHHHPSSHPTSSSDQPTLYWLRSTSFYLLPQRSSPEVTPSHFSPPQETPEQGSQAGWPSPPPMSTSQTVCSWSCPTFTCNFALPLPFYELLMGWCKLWKCKVIPQREAISLRLSAQYIVERLCVFSRVSCLCNRFWCAFEGSLVLGGQGRIKASQQPCLLLSFAFLSCVIFSFSLISFPSEIFEW